MGYEMTKLGKKPIIRDTENYFFLNLDNACVELNKKEKRIQELEKEKELWKKSACHDTNLKSMLSYQIAELTMTKNINAFLEFYYKYFKE